MADRIQHRRDTAARWAQFNPILLEGEVGYVTDDPNQYKIGDGVHAWNDLPLRGFDGILVHELGSSQTAAMSQQGVTNAFNNLERLTPIKSIEPIESMEGKYLFNGVITNAISNYHLLKFEVSKPEEYYVFSPKSVSSDTLWKYSDNTFDTPTEQIIGKVTKPTFQKVTLQAGYYAFCWNCDEINNGFIVDSNSYIAYLHKTNNELKKYAAELQTFPCVYDIATIEVGKYINDSGVISDGINLYKTVKIHLDKGCYYIHNIGNTQQIMCKYTDDTYSTAESIIIGNIYAGYSSFKQLEEGYYAFSWRVNDSGANDEPLKKAFIISTPFTDDVYKAYINSLFAGVVVDDFLIGASINPDSGIIIKGGVVINAYKLVKLYIPAGRYAIFSPGSSSQGHFWKYTDDTYETPEKEIISSHNSQSIEIDLEEGYYAFCWNDKNNNYKNITPNTASIKRIIKVEDSEFVKKLEQSKVAFNGVNIINNEIIPKCALTTNTGVIRTTDVLYQYKLVKMYLLKGDYYLKTIGSNTQDTLWKFTDETFETPEKQIIGSLTSSTDYYKKNRILSLEEGYYALGWNDGNSDGISPNCAFLIPVDKSYNELKKLYGEGISDYSNFSILNSSFTISDDKKSATSLLTGYSNRMQYNTNLYEDKFDMSTKITPLTGDSNGYFELCFGKWYNLSGTIFSIGKDEDGSFMAVYFVGSSGVPTMPCKYRITEFSIDLNKDYFINVNKRTENDSYFDVTITNSRGLTFTKKITGNFTEDDTENEGNGSNVGYAWGKICYYAILGTMKVSDINFGYPVNKASLKLVCSGHSFVEGNSISQDKDKRYVYLLCSDLGLDDTMILGQGGANTTSILGHINLQLSWLRNAEYILFSIGTNDADNSTNANRLQQINDIAESYGIKTIWLTISPKNPDGEDHPIMNAYIKEHFNYVDINPAFYLDDGVTLDTSAFLDAVHPTIATHERIYNIIKAQCSYLYCV